MKNSTFAFLPKNESTNNKLQNKLITEQPSQKSIDFILNYSRSLTVRKSKVLETVFLHLN